MSKPTDETIQEEFSKRADRFSHHEPHHHGHGLGGAESIAKIVEVTALTGREHVLDLATGGGAVAAALAPGAAEVIGIDMTPAMLEKAEERKRDEGLENVRFEVGNVVDLQYADSSFDVVTCRNSLHHFIEPAKVVAEVSRVLAPGGRFLVVETIASEDPDVHRLFDETDRLRNRSIVHVYSQTELEKLFSAGGLTTTKVIDIPRRTKFSRWVGLPYLEEATIAEIRRRVEHENLGIQVARRDDGDLELTLPDALLVATKPA